MSNAITAVMFAAVSLNVATIAAPLSITVPHPTPPVSEAFKMGESRRPDGSTLTLDSASLRLNGNPWTPVIGEFHYSRYPESEWREELLKMKAGGVDVVSSYVFWIHHEEIEGQFDWSGRRDLRHFVQLCGEVGLKALIRCGPWDHGEVRNGGLPDWILQKGWKIRSNDTNYLNRVCILYGEIAHQLSGLLWKDGGPVIGIQLENEFSGPAEHLLALKRLAREAGLDVPLYTKTGWPALSTPLPFGEIVPLYGAYAEGFWDRELTPMPGRYWTGFHFALLRSDAAIATDILGRRDAKDQADAAQYPYLTCEIGGGMMNSYHRRILIDPRDIESIALVKLGSGSTAPGYYMFHGGVNPDGKQTTLQESQATGYWNDMPVKNYDFQAPLGQYGEVRPQYHSLRRLHLFLHDWGPVLAAMPPVLPDLRPHGKDDIETLRWCVRSDGNAGFVFVNNYQRLQPMPPKDGVQFAVRLPASPVTFPDVPVTVPADACFIWPFHLDLGHGVRLLWATAQPVCAVDEADRRTVFFAETPGVASKFAFDSGTTCESFSGTMTRAGAASIYELKRGTKVAAELAGSAGGRVRIVLVDPDSSRMLWKGRWQGHDRVFLTGANLVLDGDVLRLSATNRLALDVGVYPPPVSVRFNGRALGGKTDGLFQHYEPSAPEDADFASAAVWRIRLGPDTSLAADPLLRIQYRGDVARVTLDGKLLTDDFYNGAAFDVGLRRHAPEILSGDLRLEVLPLRKGAPINIARQAALDFGDGQSIAALDRVDLVPRYEVQLSASE